LPEPVKKHFCILIFLLLLVSVLDILFGSSRLTWQELKEGLFLNQSDSAVNFVIWKYRIPKLITAMLAGAGLAVSGLLMQTLFRNPLAGPYVLGISSGAAFGVSFVMLGTSFLPQYVANFLRHDVGISMAALSGTFFVMLLMIWVAGRVGGNFTILIMGLIIGQILGALQGLTNFLANPETLKEFVLWGLGSFTQTNNFQNLIMLFAVFLSLFVAIVYSGKLNTYLLGDLYAKSLGIDLRSFRRVVIIITCIAAGIITAFCGPIAFVGLAVPHLARHLFKTYKHSMLLPASALLGAILTVVCDLISHVFIEGYIIPINVISAIFGGPVVVWVIVKQRAKMYEG